jgi:NAD-dependent deacetylase
VEEVIARLLRGRVLALTGAGIPVASGLPTFTGSGGLYEGLNPYELASPEAFFTKPEIVWRWYISRIQQGLSARPNAAHRALKDLEQIASEVTIITTNVDPLHQIAGSENVYRLHGDILQTACTTCGAVTTFWNAETCDRFSAVTEDDLPTCRCGGLLRPNVVWFGEYPWASAIEAVRQELPRADIVLEVGASGNVTYRFAETAASMGIPTVRINPDAEPYQGIMSINEPAEVALPRLVALAAEQTADTATALPTLD